MRTFLNTHLLAVTYRTNSSSQRNDCYFSSQEHRGDIKLEPPYNSTASTCSPDYTRDCTCLPATRNVLQATASTCTRGHEYTRFIPLHGTYPGTLSCTFPTIMCLGTRLGRIESLEMNLHDCTSIMHFFLLPPHSDHGLQEDFRLLDLVFAEACL